MTGRERPETQAAFQKITQAMDEGKPPIVKRMLSFQVFATVLLLILVIITTSSLSFTMRTEREARERAEARTVLFEDHVADILSSIQKSQEAAHVDRVLIQEALEELLDELDEIG